MPTDTAVRMLTIAGACRSRTRRHALYALDPDEPTIARSHHPPPSGAQRRSASHHPLASVVPTLTSGAHAQGRTARSPGETVLIRSANLQVSGNCLQPPLTDDEVGHELAAEPAMRDHPPALAAAQVLHQQPRVQREVPL